MKGTCFGHQILAHALGGRVSKNDRWEVGVIDVNLTELGKNLFQIDKPILVRLLRIIPDRTLIRLSQTS